MSSFHGYSNFFKTEENKGAVREVYAKIQRGEALHLRSRKGPKTETPKIICLGEDEDESHVTGIGNLFDFFCSGAYAQHAPVAQFRRTEIVVLCPSFFRLDPWPSIAWCPRSANGVPQPYGDKLLRTQYALLVRVLAGLYTPTTRLASESPWMDTAPASLNDVAGLDGTVAVGTRDSYAYYAAGESSCLR